MLFHFLAGRKVANVLNAILALLAALLVWHVVSLPMAVRVGATLALTVAFTNIFSRVLEFECDLPAASPGWETTTVAGGPEQAGTGGPLPEGERAQAGKSNR